MRSPEPRGWWSAVAAALLLAAAGATTSRASLVTPEFIPGNPTCAELGYDFGFKPQPEPPPSGTYSFPDGIHTVTLSSDGTLFDWTSTLGIDAVLVKGGPNADAYLYEILGYEPTADTGLHAPVNPTNGMFYAISHIEFCYDYEVTVAKTATTSYQRTWTWSIDKGVAPASWMMFAGETGTSVYTVTVARTGYVDSDWAVAGTITIANETPFDAQLESVSDSMTGAIVAPVDCGVAFPYLLPAGATLECSYASPLPDGTNRVNTAEVATSGVVGPGSDTADVVFGDPTTTVNAEIDVADSNGGSWHFADGSYVSYERTFACDGDEGSHGNTATIVQTGQSASATVVVACDEITVTKSAEPPTFTRTWEWSILKEGDQTSLLLDPGQAFVVNYTVTVTASSEDSDWHATGEIVVTNPTTMAAHVAAVTDTMPGSSAIAPDCGGAVPGFLAAGGSLVCTWAADLASGDNVLNTAHVSRTNFAWSPTGVPTPIGVTTLDATALVDFSSALVTEVDECIDVADAFDGETPVELGTVCSGDSPHTFTYAVTFQYQEPEDCGTFQEHNVASFETNDTGTTGSDDHTIDVTVTCDTGCTLTPGYWKTHSDRGPAPYDEAWLLVGPDQEATIFFLAGMSWHDALWTPPAGNAYFILAHAWIAAEINVLNGTSAPPEVLDALIEAGDLFALYTPADILADGKNSRIRRRMLELAGLLDMYNNGLIGPGHCTEDTGSTF